MTMVMQIINYVVLELAFHFCCLRTQARTCNLERWHWHRTGMRSGLEGDTAAALVEEC